MSLFKKIIILFSFFLLHSCATYEVSKNKESKFQVKTWLGETEYLDAMTKDDIYITNYSC